MKRVFIAWALSSLVVLVHACSDGDYMPKGTEGHIRDVAPAVADAWVSEVKPEQHDWSWGDGVLMFGLSEVARQWQTVQYWDYITRWMDFHIEQGYYVAFSDNCPPAIAAVRLYQKTGEERYRTVAEKTLQYVETKALRTRDGGLNHMGWVTRDQLWIDSLFMFGIFLLNMADLTGEGRYVDFLVDQITIFSSHLRDQATGLFLHMWDDGSRRTVPDGPVYWARGNAWVFVTLVEVLSRLPSWHPARSDMEQLCSSMAGSLYRYQDDSGLWHTVLNAPETYLETSASALFCYGMAKAVRLGLLDTRFATTVERSQQGLVTRLRRGCAGGLKVTGTSHGTSPGSLADYARVTVGDQVPYGVGAMMLVGAETGMAIQDTMVPEEGDCHQWNEPLPTDPEGLLSAGIYWLAKADLEKAKDYFHMAAAAQKVSGTALCGEALVDIIFLALDVFDAITLYSIGDMSPQEFRRHMREKVLADLVAIKGTLATAMQRPEIALTVPELHINRRGLYTPITDLTVGKEEVSSILTLLGMLETMLRILF